MYKAPKPKKKQIRVRKISFQFSVQPFQLTPLVTYPHIFSFIHNTFQNRSKWSLLL